MTQGKIYILRLIIFVTSYSDSFFLFPSRNHTGGASRSGRFKEPKNTSSAGVFDELVS